MQADGSRFTSHQSPARSTDSSARLCHLSSVVCHLPSAICKPHAASCELPSGHAHRKGPSLPWLRRPRVRTRVVVRSFRRPGRPARQSVVEPSHTRLECRRLGRHPGADPQQASCQTRNQGSQRCRDRHLRRDSVTMAQSFHRPSSARIPPRRGAGTDQNPPQEQSLTLGP